VDKAASWLLSLHRAWPWRSKVDMKCDPPSCGHPHTIVRIQVLNSLHTHCIGALALLEQGGKNLEYYLKEIFYSTLHSLFPNCCCLCPPSKKSNLIFYHHWKGFDTIAITMAVFTFLLYIYFNFTSFHQRVG
jgi:hypothetical protein